MSDENERDERAGRDDEEWSLDESWEVVAEVGDDEDATLIAGYLRSNDIPAEIESLRFHEGPVNFGSLGEVRVRVPRELRQEALELLSAREDDDLGEEAEEAELATEAEGPEGGGGPEEGA